MKKNILLIVVIIYYVNNTFSQCACCAGAGSALSNDNSNGVFALDKKRFIFDITGDYRTIRVGKEEGHHTSGDDLAEAEETPLTSVFLGSVGLKYGLTNRVSLSAMLPYAILNTNRGSDNGLGDLMITGAFNAVQKRTFKLVKASLTLEYSKVIYLKSVISPHC